MDDAAYPKSLGNFDKQRTVININYLLRTCLRNIQCHAVDIGIRLAIMDKAG